MSYLTTGVGWVKGDEIYIVVRMMSVQRAHPAIVITGTICPAAATALPGTIPNSVCAPVTNSTVRIGHPKGVAGARLDLDAGGSGIRSVGVSRTARWLMRGWIERPPI